MTVISLISFILSMFFISSEDIKLSQKKCITLAYACWNETSTVNENLFQAKSLVNIKYQLVLFEIKSMIKKLLLHAISNFKDLVKNVTILVFIYSLTNLHLISF